MKIKTNEDIGKRLLSLRSKAGITQDKVKMLSGLTPTQIVDLEKGRTDFRIKTLLAYIAAVKGEIKIE